MSNDNANMSSEPNIEALCKMVQNLHEENSNLSHQLDSCSRLISAIANQQAQLYEIISNQIPQQLHALGNEISAWITEDSEDALRAIDARIQKTERLLRRRFDAQLWNILFEGKQEKASINKSSTYDYIFYLNNRYHSMVSAQHILQPLFQRLPHKSVVDFGCGTGTWLWVAQALGAEDILGLDGDYVPADLLMIPKDSFSAVNLEMRCTVLKTYDLAMSMEVAEHLSADSADIFVESIAGSSDTVLFSAAHPGQGGDDHINEQPIEYWIEKF